MNLVSHPIKSKVPLCMASTQALWSMTDVIRRERESERIVILLLMAISILVCVAVV